MRTQTSSHIKRGRRTGDFPELHVGFPERNDASNPNHEIERIHVDLETLEISKKNSRELTRVLTEKETSEVEK
jgi:hypothetical protein